MRLITDASQRSNLLESQDSKCKNNSLNDALEKKRSQFSNCYTFTVRPTIVAGGVLTKMELYHDLLSILKQRLNYYNLSPWSVTERYGKQRRKDGVPTSEQHKKKNKRRINAAMPALNATMALRDWSPSIASGVLFDLLISTLGGNSAGDGR